MAFPPEFLRELEDRSRIEDIAENYVRLRRAGKNLVGLCPFHSEKTPSFNVYPGNNSYYCFGCGKGGGVINFVMDIERLDFLEAVKWLAQRAGMRMPEEGVDDSMARLRMRILEINRESGRFFYKTLISPEGEPGLNYLRGRGLDPGTIKHFGLGYAPDSGFGLVNHLRKLGYTKEELIQSDMVRTSKKGNLFDRYRGRVMFPIFDLRGNVVAFGGRILTDEKPKYINTSDTPVYHKSSGLFAMNLAKNSGSRQLILAEGYMDVIALHRAGFTNAIASLGTSLTEEQARIMKRYADEAVICYDSDSAGQKAAERAIPILKAAGLRVKVITVPGGKDPDEFMRNYGKDGPIRFRQLLEKGGTDVEYRLQKLRDQFDLDTDEGRVRYLREATQAVIAKLSDPMEQEVYAGRVAQEAGVDKSRVLETVKRLSKQERHREQRKLGLQQMSVKLAPDGDRRQDVRIRAQAAQRGIIAYLFRHQDRAEAIGKLCPPEKFITPEYQRVYNAILGRMIQDTVTLASLGEVLTGEESGCLSGILASTGDAPPNERDLKEYLRALEEETRIEGTEEWSKTASTQDIGKYLDDLRKKKA